ncbi:Uncharacterised protein [Bordetella pertussis]|nr:Uncharacterised protein [Bordetella pertussis]
MAWKNTAASSRACMALSRRFMSVRLPASQRDSSSAVSTVMSPRASRSQSSSVRTLWPGSRPRSHRAATNASTARASAADGGCGSRISRSTSECGYSSPRP